MKRFRQFSVIILILGQIFTSHAIAKTKQPYSQRQEVASFINHMVKTHHFNKQSLQQLFNKVTFRKSVIKRISAPIEAKPWHYYEKRFITPHNIDAGVAFWQKHRTVLSRTKTRYGVPPEIIVSIIGVETKYGQYLGADPVLDSLSTLAFHYPPRSKFFKKELEQFLLLCKENKVDPTQIKGSYAGAIGEPQFMPSSYRHYAVSYKPNGHRDIIHNHNDAIMSVASYLKQHGWKPGEPVFKSVTHPKKIKTTLLSFNAGKRIEYYKGLHNFHVLTKYNNSQNYVMAVDRLGQRIAKRYKNIHSRRVA